MTWILIILLSVVSAILYRLGGASKEDREKEFPWLPFKPWKSRDFFGSLVAIGAGLLVGLHAPWWAFLISFGLMWGATSTYWDEVFGYDNHYAHGLGIGLAMLPVAFYSDPFALAIRAIVLAVTMGVWSKINGKANIEELGRGALISLTFLILLLIG